jgi:Zn-dependent alcohol dehydrogenase
LPKEKKISIQTLPLHFGRTLTGSEGGQSRPHEDIPTILGQIARGVFDASGFINRRGSLAEVNQVMSEMRGGSVVHAVLVP